MPPAKQLSPESPCPCGSLKNLDNCCQPYIDGTAPAPTAEALMRSRYTAHVTSSIDYLWATWSEDQRIRSSKEDIAAWANSCDWLGLQILSTQAGQEQDNYGLVSFIALFRQNGRLEQHRELSSFQKTDQGWSYVGHAEE